MSFAKIMTMILVWLVGAVNLQIYLTQKGVYYGSFPSRDGWNITCRYYVPFRIVDVLVPKVDPCPFRMDVPKKK